MLSLMRRIVGAVVIMSAMTLLVESKWHNKAISRKVKVQKNVVEETILYSVDHVKGPKTDYEIIVDNIDHVGLITADLNGEAVKLLSSNKLLPSGQFKIDASLFDAGKTNTVKVSTVRGNQLVPFPAQTFAFDSQGVVLTLSSLVSSPYETDTEKTEIVLESAKTLISANPSDLLSVSEGLKISTPAMDASKRKELAKSATKIQIHFVHLFPLPHLARVKKTVEISHWGAAVSVKEEIELVNRGAALKGEFNRVPFVHLKYSGKEKSPFPIGHTLMSVNGIVPRDAFNIHYRDVIGNVSSSHARREAGHTLVEITPRFPMLGGWKTEFELSYDVPAAKRILQSTESGSDQFVVWVPLEHAIQNVHADELDLEIILPAGATDVSVAPPLDAKISFNKKGWMVAPWQSGKTAIRINPGPVYGRPYNLAVKYSLSQSNVFLAPLLITLYVFVFFAAFIVLRRVRLEIANTKEIEVEDIHNADYDICKQIEDLFTDLCRANSEVIDSLSRDKNELVEVKKRYTAEYERVFDEIEKFCGQFVAEKNKVDRTVRILMNLRNQKETAIALVDNAVNGKDVLSTAGVKLIEIEAEMNSLVGRVLTGTDTPPPSPEQKRRVKGTTSR